jgi:hypothetical protein
MKTSPKKIAASMRSLRLAFEPLVAKSTHAEELAFHLADIKDELAVVSRLVEKIIKSRHATHREFAILIALVGVHWPYHLSNIKRTVEKIEKAGPPVTKRHSR